MKKDSEVLRQSLLMAISKQQTPCLEKTLMKMVCGRRQLKVVVLRKLVSEGLVIRSGSGKKGYPYFYSVGISQANGSGFSYVEEIII